MIKLLILLGFSVAAASLHNANREDSSGFFAGSQVNLTEDTVKIVTLPAGSHLQLFLALVPTNVAYIVCQAHTQKGRIVLSTLLEPKYSTSVAGKDVGVITFVNSQTDIMWYLYSNSTKSTRVLLHLTFLSQDDPLPGGCNQEFPLEDDSNIHLDVQSTKTRVLFQWSAVGFLPSSECENPTLKSFLTYHAYVNYIQGGDFTENTYFNRLTEMLTAGRAQKHGTWLKHITEKEKSFFDISSYHHQGVIYNVVVKLDMTQSNIHTQAAYIPVVTYDCNIDDPSDCKHRDILGVIVVSLCAVIGGFLCFFGHRFFKTEIFLFGFIMFALVIYQVLCLSSQMTLAGIVSMTVIFGGIGGALLLALWWYCGVPILSVVFISLVFGYLVSSVLFYTPFGNISYWASSFNYGATFACGVLIVPVILLFFTRVLNIVSCALVGSYAIIFALDTYLDGGMRNILINSIRHGTDRDYVKVIVTGPFTANEIALTTVWILLFAGGIAFQLFREWKKAPFPPSPRQRRDRDRDLRRLLRPTNESVSPDRAPLLSGGDHTQYGTADSNTAEDDEDKPGIM